MRTLSFLRTIGSGGFGTVYLAELSTGRGFRRQVAVKILQRNRPDAAMFLSRIRDEARLLGLLQDDAILKVLDMVEVNEMDAVVMEYVEGADLESLTAGGHAPPPRALAEIGAAVAGALSRAHAAHHPASGEPLNVIHRDVKPGNVMITSSGGVKLLDFGVARARFDARESYTGQLVLGTLNFMAPEYIVTGEVSPAADVYGLALTIWQVASGQAFGQPKVRQDSHERRVAERLDLLRSTHGELVPVLEEMLRWNPTERPDAGSVERHMLEAADALSGTGLRSWARAIVPDVVRGRPAAPDTAKLLGRTCPLGAGHLEGPDTSVPPAPVELLAPEAPTPHLNDLQPALDEIPLPAELSAGGAAGVEVTLPVEDEPPPVRARTAPPPDRPARPSPPRRRHHRRRTSTLGLVIKGVLIGSGLGFLALIAVFVVLLLT